MEMYECKQAVDIHQHQINSEYSNIKNFQLVVTATILLHE